MMFYRDVLSALRQTLDYDRVYRIGITGESGQKRRRVRDNPLIHAACGAITVPPLTAKAAALVNESAGSYVLPLVGRDGKNILDFDFDSSGSTHEAADALRRVFECMQKTRQAGTSRFFFHWRDDYRLPGQMLTLRALQSKGSICALRFCTIMGTVEYPLRVVIYVRPDAYETRGENIPDHRGWIAFLCEKKTAPNADNVEELFFRFRSESQFFAGTKDMNSWEDRLLEILVSALGWDNVSLFRSPGNIYKRMMNVILCRMIVHFPGEHQYEMKAIIPDSWVNEEGQGYDIDDNSCQCERGAQHDLNEPEEERFYRHTVGPVQFMNELSTLYDVNFRYWFDNICNVESSGIVEFILAALRVVGEKDWTFTVNREASTIRFVRETYNGWPATTCLVRVTFFVGPNKLAMQLDYASVLTAVVTDPHWVDVVPSANLNASEILERVAETFRELNDDPSEFLREVGLAYFTHMDRLFSGILLNRQGYDHGFYEKMLNRPISRACKKVFLYLFLIANPLIEGPKHAIGYKGHTREVGGILGPSLRFAIDNKFPSESYFRQQMGLRNHGEAP